MPFWKSVRRALGMDHNEYTEDADIVLDDDRAYHATAAPARPEADAPASTVCPDEISRQILGEVVALFNGMLPPVLSQNLNAEAEAAYLYDHLSPELKTRLAEMDPAAFRIRMQEYEVQIKAQQAEIAVLHDNEKTFEDKRQQLKEARLSAERQKSALSARVRDLEENIERLQADIDQYQLENKSLLNRIRLSGLDDQAQPAPVVDDKALEELEQKIEQFEQVRSSLDARIADLQSQLDDRDTTIAHLQSQLEAVMARRGATTARPNADEAIPEISDISDTSDISDVSEAVPNAQPEVDPNPIPVDLDNLQWESTPHDIQQPVDPPAEPRRPRRRKADRPSLFDTPAVPELTLDFGEL